MNKTLKTLSVMAVLFTAFAVSAQAGGNNDKTYYSRMTAKTTGQGLVYVGTSNATPADSEYKTEASQSLNTTNDQTHTYYLFAQDGEEAFEGWYTDENCNDWKSNDNPYRYTDTATSTNSNSPTQFSLYAKFVRQDFNTYSSLTAESTGGGMVFVSVSSSAEPVFDNESSATQSVVNGTTHNYYLYAQPESGLSFLGWFADEACTQLLQLDSNVYTFESKSREAEAPEEQTIYAKFGENPYQIPNSGFEQWNDAVNEPNPGWHSFPTGTGSLIGIAGSGLQAKRVEGRTGYAAQVNSVSKMGVGANGNLTTGRINAGSMTATDATGNYNYSDLDNEGFYLTIEGQPDAIEFYAKFSAASNNTNGCAHMQTYMHKRCSRFQDPRMDSQNAYLLAAAGINIMPSDEWQRYEAKFSYENYSVDELNAETKYMLVSFSTNPTPGQSYGDLLTVDDVRLIYNSELTSLKYDGVAVIIEDGKIYIGDDDCFDRDKLEIVSGRAAEIACNDNEDGQLVITIKGQDYEVNPANIHTYTFDILNGEAPTALDFRPNRIYTLRAAGYEVYATTNEMSSTSTAGTTYTFGAEPESFRIVKANGGYTIQSEKSGKYIGLNQWDVVDNAYVWNIVAVDGLKDTYKVLDGETGKGLGWDAAAAGDGIYTDKGDTAAGNQWVIEAVKPTEPVKLQLSCKFNEGHTKATVTVEGLTGFGTAYWFIGDDVTETSEGTPITGNTFVVTHPEKDGDASDVTVTVREYDYDISPVAMYSNGSITIEQLVPAAISDVKAADNTVIYNLNGQRITSLRRGLNIVNGRKVVR